MVNTYLTKGKKRKSVLSLPIISIMRLGFQQIFYLKYMNIRSMKHIPKRQSYPCNRPWRPIGLWDVEASKFSLDSRFTDGAEIVSLTRRQPFTPRKISGIHFCLRLSRPQGHSAAGMVRSIEKYNDHIGYRTSDLPACSIVPQPTTLPRAPVWLSICSWKHILTVTVQKVTSKLDKHQSGPSH
jgi:hypothetical protein